MLARVQKGLLAFQTSRAAQQALFASRIRRPTAGRAPPASNPGSPDNPVVRREAHATSLVPFAVTMSASRSEPMVQLALNQKSAPLGSHAQYSAVAKRRVAGRRNCLSTSATRPGSFQLSPSRRFEPKRAVMTTLEFDVVLFGATGFTGRLVASALATLAPKPLRLAMVGRSAEKLKEVQRGLGPDGARYSVLTCDATDAVALAQLARRTKVICTTVGPYAKYGMGVVQACAEGGTHYCDITGEVQFMRDAIDRFDATAKKNKAKIVHTCGFDSIPSDMGVLYLSESLKREGKSGALTETALCVESAKGKFSGGTVASLVNVLDEVKADAGRRKLMFDPYALSPQRALEPDFGSQRGLASARYDALLDRWTAPFVMEAINTRVVRRSNALSDYAYGKEFRYREVTGCGKGLAGATRSAAVTGGMGALMAGLQSNLTRNLVMRVLPKPGEGPNEQERKSGFFKIRIASRTAEGEHAEAWVRGKGDPGYDATSRMLAQAALALALDEGTERFGMLTPSTAFGIRFIERLDAADIRFSRDANRR